MTTKKQDIKEDTQQASAVEQETSKKMCGIIMPIADHPDYPKGHWVEVLSIVKQAIDSVSLESRIVSDDISIGLIHERIVTNIYNDDIVVCDVSSKNPNVMFELGLRLAFDKPTIIIKDEKTGYSFDTSPIEHLSYPSSLRFTEIIKFKEKLAEKIKGTLDKFRDEPDFSPFLKSFGRTIVPAKIGTTEVSMNDFVIDKLDKISKTVSILVDDRNKNINEKWFRLSKNEQDSEKYNYRITLDLPDAAKRFIDQNIEDFKDKEPTLDDVNNITNRTLNYMQKAKMFPNKLSMSEAENKIISYLISVLL
ncbi:hypothetical protein HX049_02560 [Myroides odoratimimus]|uniref:RNA helicase n=1 Tax=Myroides odoratimimus TaxID=76832 RepID=UPI002577A086|nr:RNA helicase [Myroides odoratimimus]MDM1396062.1 hypothetical protein [Myroides odoratimimus]